jgi:hypothetical protein
VIECYEMYFQAIYVSAGWRTQIGDVHKRKRDLSLVRIEGRRFSLGWFWAAQKWVSRRSALSR